MKVVKTFSSPIEANIAKGFLESNGIDALLFDENTIYINPVLTTAVGGVKLLVSEEDYSNAIQLFEETENEHVKKQSQLDCPLCNSKDIISTNKHNWFALLLMLISFSFTPNSGNHEKHKCRQCNHSW